MRFASGYRQRLPSASHRNAAAMPIPLRSKPPASIVWWRSDRSKAHCRKPTISPPPPHPNEWRLRWRAMRPLHCVFRQAPLHRDYRQAQPGRADKAGPKETGPFLPLSKQLAGRHCPGEASASPRKPKKKRYLPALAEKISCNAAHGSLPCSRWSIDGSPKDRCAPSPPSRDFFNSANTKSSRRAALLFIVCSILHFSRLWSRLFLVESVYADTKLGGGTMNPDISESDSIWCHAKPLARTPLLTPPTISRSSRRR